MSMGCARDALGGVTFARRAFLGCSLLLIVFHLQGCFKEAGLTEDDDTREWRPPFSSSPTAAPPRPPPPPPQVIQAMTIEAISYDSLVSNATIMAEFETVIKNDVADMAGDDVTPDMVTVVVSAGSVSVEATITLVETQKAVEITERLEASRITAASGNGTSLEAKVATNIAEIKGIEEVSTGELTVWFDPPVPKTAAPTPVPTPVPTPEPATPEAPAPSTPTTAPTLTPSGTPTDAPTSTPSSAPTLTPSGTPTDAPTSAPNLTPSGTPTDAPTSTASSMPTLTPSGTPTEASTLTPTSVPTTTPSSAPTASSTSTPTHMPPTLAPNSAPASMPAPVPISAPTLLPTSLITSAPSSMPAPVPISAPTLLPTPLITSAPAPMPAPVPISAPTLSPTSLITSAPSSLPSLVPTSAPTQSPTPLMTSAPSQSPTQSPTPEPVLTQTSMPTPMRTEPPTVGLPPLSGPTPAPTSPPAGRTTAPTSTPALTPAPMAAPTSEPPPATGAPSALVPSPTPGPLTAPPTLAPTRPPRQVPTVAPTAAPTQRPRRAPMSSPTAPPMATPIAPPTLAPTRPPTRMATEAPTAAPTVGPTQIPMSSPTAPPMVTPIAPPTLAPTLPPTRMPTTPPTSAPTTAPMTAPTVGPTQIPTSSPTLTPTTPMNPTSQPVPTQPEPEPEPAPTATPPPTLMPTPPTAIPTAPPTLAPTLPPTQTPTTAPTAGPTVIPTSSPTSVPTSPPSSAPTAPPTVAPTPAPTPAPSPSPTPDPTAELASSAPTQPPDCLSTCGSSPGFCAACNSADGTKGACCKLTSGGIRDGDDPEECQGTPKESFPGQGHHVCVLLPAKYQCYDVQPPSHWAQNTCEKQLQNTDTCEKRRAGTNNDGFCLKTCGVCTPAPTAAPTLQPTVFQCVDVPPPSNWGQNTCEKQLQNTDNCERRRAGTNNDGYCHKTCGVCTPSPTTAPTPEPTLFQCVDVQPPSHWVQNTCEKQLQNTDTCEKRRAGTNNDGYCHETCGVCTPSPTIAPTLQPTVFQCVDVPPPSHWGENTCEKQLRNTDKCEKRREGTNNDGYCHRTCGVCTSAPTITPTPAPTICYDVPPPATWAENTCEKQLTNTDKCEKRREGTNNDGYCHKTCGVCTDQPTPAPTPAPPTPAPTFVPDGYKFVGRGYCTAGELSTQCYDVQPPSSWSNPTCDAVWENTESCAARRSGSNNDQYCHKTCGVCSESVAPAINCWNKCNQAGGYCDHCAGSDGAVGACCKLESNGNHRGADPQECKLVRPELFPTSGSHTCVFVPTETPPPAKLHGYCKQAMTQKTTCTQDGDNMITSFGSGQKDRDECAQECNARADCGFFFFNGGDCQLYKECTNTRTTSVRGTTWGKCREINACADFCNSFPDCEFFSLVPGGNCSIFSKEAGNCNNRIDETFTTFRKWTEPPSGYDYVGRGRCSSNELSNPDESTNAGSIEKCAQKCSNVNNCWRFAFILGQRCHLYSSSGSCSGNDFIVDDSYAAFSKSDSNTYVAGTPGAPWSRQEMLVVKAKLYKAFPPSGGRTVWGQLSQADRNDHPWNNNTWFSGANARKILRLGFHDCLRYAEGGGGCDGCLDWEGMANRFEATERRWHWDHSVLGHGHNNALKHTILFLEELYTNRHYPADAPSLPRSLKAMGKSRADLWAFAGKAAVEYGIEANNIFCDVHGRPKWNYRQHFGNVCQMNQEKDWCKIVLDRPILFKSGRKDCVTNEDKPYKSPSSLHEVVLHSQANGQMVLDYFRQQFDMGARETAAIMGAHTMAGMHVSHSLFRYGWTARNSWFFNNAYYRLLVGKPDWRFDDDACTKLGDAFNHEPKSRWIAVVWLNTDVGGPVQWINEKYTCDPCHWNEYKDSACCTGVPSGQMCHSDRSGPEDTNYDTDNDIVWGCEGYKLIPGQDEAMLSVDMGLYFHFDVDENLTPKNCPGLENFKTSKWEQGLNLYSTNNGVWDRETGNWRNTYTAKKEPACPKNNAADPGDKPIYQILEDYAEDNNVFARDFVPAFEKMINNGYADSELTDCPDITTGVTCAADKILDRYFECTDEIIV